MGCLKIGANVWLCNYLLRWFSSSVHRIWCEPALSAWQTSPLWVFLSVSSIYSQRCSLTFASALWTNLVWRGGFPSTCWCAGQNIAQKKKRKKHQMCWRDEETFTFLRLKHIANRIFRISIMFSTSFRHLVVLFFCNAITAPDSSISLALSAYLDAPPPNIHIKKYY